MSRPDQNLSENEIFEKVAKYGDMIGQLANGSLYKRELANALDVSESTVYRRARCLTDLSLVRHGQDGYCLTNLGELYSDWYRRTRRDAQRLYESREVLEVCDISIPYQMFRNSTMAMSKQFAPDSPMKKIEELVRSSLTIRGISPVVVDPYVTLFASRLKNSEFDAELIFQSAATDYLKAEYPHLLEAFSDGRSRILKSSVDFSFGLLIAEEPTQQVLLIVYDSNMSLRGTIESKANKAIEWAKSTYSEYETTATRIEIDELEAISA